MNSAQQGYTTSSHNINLPFTGLDVGFLLVAGVALLAVGAWMRQLVKQT